MEPIYAIGLIAGWISLSFLLFQKIQLNDPEAKKAKEKMEIAQKKMKEMQKGGKIDDKLLDELLSAQSVIMKKTMIPTLILSFFTLFIFNKLSAVYTGITIVLPFLIPLPVLAFPPIVLKNTLGWLGWYVLCSLGWSMTLRPLLGVKI